VKIGRGFSAVASSRHDEPIPAKSTVITHPMVKINCSLKSIQSKLFHHRAPGAPALFPRVLRCPVPSGPRCASSCVLVRYAALPRATGRARYTPSSAPRRRSREGSHQVAAEKYAATSRTPVQRPPPPASPPPPVCCRLPEGRTTRAWHRRLFIATTSTAAAATSRQGGRLRVSL
jgi:hypothetical protein